MWSKCRSPPAIQSGCVTGSRQQETKDPDKQPQEPGEDGETSTEGLAQESKNKPAIQDTKLGWLVSDPTGQDRLKSLKVTCSFSQELQDNLKRFWEIEESYSEQFARSPDEHFCERQFVETTKRLDNGRFSVLMPLKEEPKCALGDSYAMAKKRLLNLETRLDKNPELKDAYSKFINEYKELGHLIEIARPQFSVYLPHHCIIKEHHETTKVRVVFDASATTTSGKSLNDIQAAGPVI
ncbi:uncharacterized protein LOC113507495 [Trichoplusia ni]|uniref:Uncharacterized protein LOC113507495 n=1 Tax=Trichoplusia ni TaxID=7111 RepID=A0A7E5X156_TRINI|nr:uncharacterized protein LOC113507495 [Trichoplusia ni]